MAVDSLQCPKWVGHAHPARLSRRQLSTRLLTVGLVRHCTGDGDGAQALAGGERATYRRELLRNPLILSTVAGLVANLAGLHLPEAVATTLQRIGLAALPLRLMAVGAGLRLLWRCRPSNA